MKLTNEQRIALRSAVRNHPNYNQKLHPTELKAEVLNSCEALGIAVADIIGKVVERPAAPRVAPITENEVRPSIEGLVDAAASAGRRVIAGGPVDIGGAAEPVEAMLQSVMVAAAPVDSAALPADNKVVPLHQPNGSRVAPRSKGMFPAHKVFRLTSALKDAQGKVLQVEVFDDPDAPAIDPDYIFQPEVVHAALACLRDPGQPFPMWLYGPYGTGKTTFFQQCAAVLGRSFYRIQGHGAIEPMELLGQKLPDDGGKFKWNDGALLRAVRHPQAIVLVDEITLLKPEYLAVLRPLFERRMSLTINETGERVRLANGVWMNAADNTNGRGDMSGAYAGCQQLNTADVSRFTSFVPLNYLNPVKEARLLSVISGLSIEACTMLVDLVTTARQQVAGGQLVCAPSLRELVAWSQLLLVGLPSRDAFEMAVANRFPSVEAEVLQGLYKSKIDEAKLKAAVSKPSADSGQDLL